MFVLLCVFALVSCGELSFPLDNPSDYTITNIAFIFEADGKSVSVAADDGRENYGHIKIPDVLDEDDIESTIYAFVDAIIVPVIDLDWTKHYPVTKIAENGFQEQDEIKSVTIPTSIKSIGAYAFADCTSLTTIKFEGTMAQWKAITLGENWNHNVPATEVTCSDGTVSLK